MKIRVTLGARSALLPTRCGDRLLSVSMTTAPLTRRPRRITEKFPITILFGLQYGALVAFPALTHDTEPLALIITICAVGVGAAFLVEALRAPLGRRAAPLIPTSPRAPLCIVRVGLL